MSEVRLLHGDSRDLLKTLPENSVESLVCDPPAGIAFMGKAWDRDKGGRAGWIAWMQGIMSEALRVVKPGGYGLVWALPKTSHWTATALEDSGWEIRDVIVHSFGSGFPKSLDISKSLDAQAKNRIINVCKAIDNLDETGILSVWKTHLEIVNNAATSSPKSRTEIGSTMARSDFVAVDVQRLPSAIRSQSPAITAELASLAARLTCAGPLCFALSSAADHISASNDLAATAAYSRESPGAPSELRGSTVLGSALVFISESIIPNLMAVEALKTWLGSKPSSEQEASSALSAALTEDLKRIIFSQSKTFQTLGTNCQTAFASATNVTITESTAVSLISFTAGILRSKTASELVQAEREVVGRVDDKGRASTECGGPSLVQIRSLPATDEAKQFAGFGSALKPANEHWILVRKPLSEGNLALNALKHGTGGLNIDASRIGEGAKKWETPRGGIWQTDAAARSEMVDNPLGRFPSNLLLSHSPLCVPDECHPTDCPLAVMDRQSGPRKAGGKVKGHEASHTGDNGIYGRFERVENVPYEDEGGASRFFASFWPDPEAPFIYTPKPSGAEKNKGCEGMAAGVIRINAPRGCEADKLSASQPRNNSHPTVKSTSLMLYLIRLCTPPGGTVLDPFLGSGTTGVAAVQGGFGFIGMEQEQEYIDIARARLKHAQGRTGLFADDE